MDCFDSFTKNESYSREKPTRVSPYPKRRYADVGRHVQRKTKTLIQNTKTKTKPFYLLYISRRLCRPLLEQTANQGAPSSCPEQK